MLFAWLDSREATRVGHALADEFVAPSESASIPRRNKPATGTSRDLQRFLARFQQRIDKQARDLHLNLFQRVKLVHSFKWRLREQGIEHEVVDELSHALLLRLNGTSLGTSAATAEPHTARLRAGEGRALLAEGTDHLSRGDYDKAVRCFHELLKLEPRHAVLRNNLGTAYWRLGRYEEAETQFRTAIGIKPGYAEAHCNLGGLLRARGRVSESEAPLRRALKLQPVDLDAQASLSATLLLLGRLSEAKSLLEKVLKTAPRNVAALVGLGQIAGTEGRLEEAETLYQRAAEIDSSAPSPWAAIAWLRRMSGADRAWVERAERLASAATSPLEEANLRYAMGKYYDDSGNFKRAFDNFRRANELRRAAVAPYDRKSRVAFVDDLVRVYTREALAKSVPDSTDPEPAVLVVGMPRSGTTLVAQIIASHPQAHVAGELPFWSQVMHRHDRTIRQRGLDTALRGKLAAQYRSELAQSAAGAARVVDKWTFNAEFLGVIHSALPGARVIHLRRNPIDTCLSCYFQQLSPEMNFTMDLADLAHYYREHERLMAHWRRVLPPGVLLEVPYEGLVADQESWTRRILEFIGLSWDERCLKYHDTQRTVATASFWQVRQPLYSSSVDRWRNYERFIGPLLGLKDLPPP